MDSPSRPRNAPPGSHLSCQRLSFRLRFVRHRFLKRKQKQSSVQLQISTIPRPPGAGRYSRQTAAPISSSVPPQRPPRRWRPPTNTNGTRQAAHAQRAEAGRLTARDAPLGPPLLSAAAFGSPASAERPPRAAEPSRRRR